jgi:hypothetical protein
MLQNCHILLESTRRALPSQLTCERIGVGITLGGEMVFPKLPDVADLQAQMRPVILAPYLLWAFIGDMWAATLELAMSPVPPNDSEDSNSRRLR